MKKGSKPSCKIAKIIAAEAETNFMRVARLLRELQEQNPDDFVAEAKQAGIKRRHAYALARIAQKFDGLKIPDQRLRSVGWAKLDKAGEASLLPDRHYVRNDFGLQSNESHSASMVTRDLEQQCQPIQSAF
jgi:hypothetical protein